MSRKKKQNSIDLFIRQMNKPGKFGRPGKSKEKNLHDIRFYKYDHTYGDTVELYEKLPKLYQELFYKENFPNQIKELNKGTYGYAKTSLESNLNGMLALFNIYRDKIDLFLKQKNEFEKYFLIGQYEKAQNTLNNIDDNISFSNWTIYHNLLIKEYTDGFEASIALLEKILDNGPEHPFHSIFNFSFTRMVDKDLSINSYKTFIEHDVYQYYNIETKQIKKYIQSYIDPFEIFNCEDFTGVFLGNEGDSLIDKYITFRKILINVSFNDKKLAVKLLKKALKFNNDPQLQKLYFFLSSDLDFYENTDEIKHIYTILDLYSEGNYQQCINQSKKYLLTWNLSIDIIEIYLKSTINLNKDLELLCSNSMLDGILLNMYNILKKNHLTVGSINNLSNIALSLHNFDISIQLVYFINKIKSITENNFYNKIHQIYLPCITPKSIYEFDNIKVQKEILNKLSLNNDKHKTIDFFHILLEYKQTGNMDTSHLNIPEHRLILHKSKILYQKNDFNQVILYIEPMLEKIKSIPHIYEECLIKLYSSYSMNNHTKECIRLYVDNYFFNHYLLDNINTKKEIDFISDLGYKHIEVDLDLIIFLHINKANTKITSLVYRILIRNLNIKKPTEINLEPINTEKLIYFLRYICVQDILSKDVINFKTSDVVELERLKICQLLLVHDDSNNEIYNDEIIKITQNMKIKERIREVDNSKIYVDINGLINFDLKDFEKQFLRYMKIYDLIEKTSGDYKMLVYSSETLSFETEHEYNKKYITLTDQLYKIFIELFMEINDQYLFSNEHGLDTYLSTRIRHGTITGQLRKTFSDLRLITTKDSITNIYKDNRSWTASLNIEEESILRFNKIMNQFSQDIDTYNNYIKNDLIQIKTDLTNEALFNFSIYEYFNSHIINHFYKNIISAVNNYEEFITYTIETIEMILDHNLELIRNYFNKNIKEHYLELIDNLEKDIILENENKQYSQLLNNIRHSRTEIQNTIDLTSSWFDTKKKKNINFTLGDVIDTSKAIVNNLVSSSISIHTVSETDNSQVYEGKYFLSFVDCFKIFFENIVNYVKEKNHIEANILIYVDDFDDYFICRIENEIIHEGEEDFLEIDDTIKQKNIDIEKGTNSIANRKEKNSGIVKANNMLKRALNNIKNQLTFKRDSNRVVVELKIYKRGLLYENIDS